MNNSLQPGDPFRKAYNRGCMWGMSGGGMEACPYADEDLADWWESGWREGHEAFRDQPGNPRAVNGPTPG